MVIKPGYQSEQQGSQVLKRRGRLLPCEHRCAGVYQGSKDPWVYLTGGRRVPKVSATSLIDVIYIYDIKVIIG
eukprot:6269516-Pyramimonas_sp.AAC.2